MAKAKGKTTKHGTRIISKNHATAKTVEFNLGDVRARFDGLKDVAAKLPETPEKRSLMGHIEEAYLATANWGKNLVGGMAFSV